MAYILLQMNIINILCCPDSLELDNLEIQGLCFRWMTVYIGAMYSVMPPRLLQPKLIIKQCSLCSETLNARLKWSESKTAWVPLPVRAHQWNAVCHGGGGTNKNVYRVFISEALRTFLFCCFRSLLALYDIQIKLASYFHRLHSISFIARPSITNDL